MSSKSWMKRGPGGNLFNRDRPEYFQVSPGIFYDFSSTKQDAKKWNTHTSKTGHVTIGKSARA